MAKIKRFVKINLSENLRLIGSMSEDERADYELKMREQIVKGIDNYLSKGILQNEIVEYNKGLNFDMDQIEIKTKLGLYVSKLLSNFDIISDRIIASYTWEMNRTSSIPSDPTSYQNIVKTELNINEKVLMDKFVSHLDKQEKEKKDGVRL